MLTILASTSNTTIAATQVFQEHNFAMEIPSNWHELKPPPPQVLAAMQSPDRLKTILIFAQKFSEAEAPTVVRDMMAGSKQRAIDQGWQVTNERTTSIDGVPFNVVLTRVNTNSTMVTYFGIAGNDGYWLSGYHSSGNADSDDELISSIKSFRLLTRRSIPVAQIQPVSDAYGAGYFFGRLLMLALVGVAILWVVRHFMGKKR